MPGPFVGRDQRVIAFAERGGFAKTVRQIGFGGVACRLAAGTPPGFDVTVEDMQAISRVSIEPEKPVAADSLAVLADVVVEDDPIALTDPPAPKGSLRRLARRDEPFARRIAGLGTRRIRAR